MVVDFLISLRIGKGGLGKGAGVIGCSENRGGIDPGEVAGGSWRLPRRQLRGDRHVS